MLKEYEIRGLRIEKFIQKISEKNYKNNERYVFNCVENKKRYEIIIYIKYLENEDKKTIINIKEVKHFNGINYLPTKPFSIKFDSQENEHYNQAFNIYDNCININYDYFKKTKRAKKFRPVWIIKGESGLGKTFLSSIIFNNSDLTIYETDSSSKLHDAIYEDIIVIGNKYKYSTDEIEKNIYGEHESIIVNFCNKK